MLRKILTRFSAASNRETLAEILSHGENREFLLGVQRGTTPPTPEQMNRDADRVVRYSQSEDYATWAKGAWADVTRYLDILIDEKATAEQAAFSRGSLSATIKLLRDSYKARDAREADIKTV